jgi:hypothetical protein
MKRLGALLLVAGAMVLWMIVPTIAANTVTSSDIVDRTIRNRDIGTDQVDRRIIAPGTIQRAEIHPLTLRSFQNNTLSSGVTVHGVIGGDFEGFAATPGGPCEDNCDWGVDASLPFPAPVGLGDDDVLVDVSTCLPVCSGVTADPDEESDSAATCTGSVDTPTAPAGKVCIYVAGADNAVNIVGFSVRPGLGKSKYGFKLGWVSQTATDTFVDAVWAYTAP